MDREGKGAKVVREEEKSMLASMRWKTRGGEGGSSHLHRRRTAEWQSKARRPAAINNVTPPKI